MYICASQKLKTSSVRSAKAKHEISALNSLLTCDDSSFFFLVERERV